MFTGRHALLAITIFALTTPSLASASSTGFGLNQRDGCPENLVCAGRAADGKVLTAGGSGDLRAELYDPGSGTFAFTGSLNEARGGATWVTLTGVVSISFSATGAQPIAPTTVSGATASVAFSAEGVSTLSFAARDNAGNVETAHHLTIRIDKTAPRTAASQTPTANANGWNRGPVSVSLAAQDSLSGVAALTFAASGAQTIAATTVAGNNATIPITAEGITTLTFAARDNAGNPETTRTQIVRIDLTAPEATLRFDETPATSRCSDATPSPGQ